jgi:hypothetical protein
MEAPFCVKDTAPSPDLENKAFLAVVFLSEYSE